MRIIGLIKKELTSVQRSRLHVKLFSISCERNIKRFIGLRTKCTCPCWGSAESIPFLDHTFSKHSYNYIYLHRGLTLEYTRNLNCLLLNVVRRPVHFHSFSCFFSNSHFGSTNLGSTTRVNHPGSTRHVHASRSCVEISQGRSLPLY